MWAFVKLQVKESRKKSGFLLFAIIGLIVTLIILMGGEFSVNGGPSSQYSQYGFQWTFLNAIACLATVTLSMGVLSRFRQSGQGEILRLHGLGDRRQYMGIFIGNAIISLIMALLLLLGMISSILIKGPSLSYFGFFLALLLYMFSVLLSSILMTFFSLFLPPAVAALIGIFFVVVGSLRGVFELIMANMGGLFGTGMNLVLQVFPPLQALGQIQRDLFFGESASLILIFQAFLYLWVLLGVVHLGIEWRIRHEK